MTTKGKTFIVSGPSGVDAFYVFTLPYKGGHVKKENDVFGTPAFFHGLFSTPEKPFRISAERYTHRAKMQCRRPTDESVLKYIKYTLANAFFNDLMATFAWFTYKKTMFCTVLPQKAERRKQFWRCHMGREERQPFSFAGITILIHIIIYIIQKTRRYVRELKRQT